jgi:subtilisin
VIAVSAIGLRSAFPPGSVGEADVALPVSTADPDIFVAAFTNVGPQIKFAAPGVGIVSTVPGGFTAMSGTSMSAQ